MNLAHVWFWFNLQINKTSINKIGPFICHSKINTWWAYQVLLMNCWGVGSFCPEDPSFFSEIYKRGQTHVIWVIDRTHKVFNIDIRNLSSWFHEEKSIIYNLIISLEVEIQLKIIFFLSFIQFCCGRTPLFCHYQKRYMSTKVSSTYNLVCWEVKIVSLSIVYHGYIPILLSK